MSGSTHSELGNEQQGKNVAIVCYITLIGWIIALLMNSGDKSKLGAFHLRQSLGLIVLVFCVYILNYPLSGIPYFGWISSSVLNIGLVVFWVMGLISAIQAQEKPLPLVGELFQKIFAQLI